MNNKTKQNISKLCILPFVYCLLLSFCVNYSIADKPQDTSLFCTDLNPQNGIDIREVCAFIYLFDFFFLNIGKCFALWHSMK